MVSIRVNIQRHVTKQASFPRSNNPDNCNNHVVVLQTTAGWRKAPASAQRVCTRGLASLSSISPKNTMLQGIDSFIIHILVHSINQEARLRT